MSRAEQCFADIARLAEELSRSNARCRELAHEYFTRPWSDELVRRTGNILSPASAAQVPCELQAEALRCQCQILALGERSEALQGCAQQLLRLGQLAQSPARVAEGECFLALAALNTGQVERARGLLTGALAVARAGGHRRSQALALHWLAELQLRQGQLSSARELQLELLEQVPAAGDNAVALARLGDTLARLGELRAAEDRPIVLFDWRSHALLAEVARRSGESRLAARSLARARESIRALGVHLEPDQRAAWLAAAGQSALGRS